MSNNRCRTKARYGSNVEPQRVNGQLTARTEFYKTELLNMIKGLFKLKTPIEWERDYVLNNLLSRGYFILADTPVGVIPCRGSLAGFNVWDYPTKAIIDMPIIGSFERTIGEDCSVIFLERTRFRSFYTFNKLVEIYAYKLASADSAIEVNLFNSRVAYMAEAESKSQAEAIKKMYEEVTDGEPLVVYRTDLLNKHGLNVIFNNIKQNFIADLVQDSKRTIINEFLTRVGINNANTDKKERLIVGEVESNNVELRCNIEEWKQNLKISNERAYKVFPELKETYKLKLKFDPKTLAERSEKVVENNDTMGGEGTMGGTKR